MKRLKGIVLHFCNGLSLDYGEHPGLLIVIDSSENTYNVLLNPYKHYSFQKGECIEIPIKSLPETKKVIQPMCPPIGDIFVELNE